MKLYHVLLTDDQGVFLKFSMELGRFILPNFMGSEAEVLQASLRCTHDVPPGEKGKQV